MSEMIDRVAKAICGASGMRWDDMLSGARDQFRRDARAAIEAMREPTEAMVKAAQEETYCHSWSSRGEHIEDPEVAWTAMIDAALGEQPGDAPARPPE
jgi:hypothetical protein